MEIREEKKSAIFIIECIFFNSQYCTFAYILINKTR